MNSNRLFAALVTLILCASSNVRAADIIFTFDDADDELSVITNTVSGITLTLLNPSPRTAFKTDADGLAVGLQGSFISGASLTSFQLQVTGGTITLKSYELLQSVFADSATFAMSGGSGNSTGNSLANTGNINANGNWTLTPSQTGTLTASGFVFGGYVQFQSFTFTVVPEPSTYALGVTATGVIAFAARRRKSRIA